MLTTKSYGGVFWKCLGLLKSQLKEDYIDNLMSTNATQLAGAEKKVRGFLAATLLLNQTMVDLRQSGMSYPMLTLWELTTSKSCRMLCATF